LPGTVRKHLDNVYRKLGVRSRAEAVAVTRVTRSPDSV
jgi:DNA-binding CsgD family transcriptional regulator